MKPFSTESSSAKPAVYFFAAEALQRLSNTKHRAELEQIAAAFDVNVASANERFKKAHNGQTSILISEGSVHGGIDSVYDSYQNDPEFKKQQVGLKQRLGALITRATNDEFKDLLKLYGECYRVGSEPSQERLQHYDDYYGEDG